MANAPQLIFMAYVTALGGFLTGGLFLLATEKLAKSFYVYLRALVAGILIAFVCFSMLPEAFNAGGVIICVIGIVLGTFAAMLAESKTEKAAAGSAFKTSLVLITAIAVHKLPEGVALGALLRTDYALGVQMAVIMLIHSIPESLFLGLTLRKSGVSYAKVLLMCVLMPVPVAAGGAFGVFLADISTIFTSVCMSFAGGVMIYIGCGEILPSAKKTAEKFTGGYLLPLWAMIGFAAEIFIMLNV